MPTKAAGEPKNASGMLEITPRANGPLLLKGNFEIQDENGQSLFQGKKATLCHCDGSQNKPFCDSTHKINGFITS